MLSHSREMACRPRVRTMPQSAASPMSRRNARALTRLGCPATRKGSSPSEGSGVAVSGRRGWSLSAQAGASETNVPSASADIIGPTGSATHCPASSGSLDERSESAVLAGNLNWIVFLVTRPASCQEPERSTKRASPFLARPRSGARPPPRTSPGSRFPHRRLFGRDGPEGRRSEMVEGARDVAPDRGVDDLAVDHEDGGQALPELLRLADQLHRDGGRPDVVGRGLHRDQNGVAGQNGGPAEFVDPRRAVDHDYVVILGDLRQVPVEARFRHSDDGK